MKERKQKDESKEVDRSKEKQQFPDTTGLMHIRTHRVCDSRNKTYTRSSPGKGSKHEVLFLLRKLFSQRCVTDVSIACLLHLRLRVMEQKGLESCRNPRNRKPAERACHGEVAEKLPSRNLTNMTV